MRVELPRWLVTKLRRGSRKGMRSLLACDLTIVAPDGLNNALEDDEEAGEGVVVGQRECELAAGS